MFDSKGLAKLISEYCLSLRRGDLLVIYSSYEALPLVRELYAEALTRGVYPYTVFVDEVLDEVFLNYADKEVLERVPRFVEVMYEEMTARASILSSTHTRHLAGVNPEKLRVAMKSREKLTKVFMERQARGELRWVVAPYPTKAMAQEAGMGLLEFEAFIERACMLNEPNPAESWEKKAKQQQKIADRLNKARTLEIKGENVNLRVSVEGRYWINDDGKKNMPGGEVFTGPVEESVEGWVRFTYPAVWRGVVVEGVELEFKDGRVVKARAEKGEDKLNSVLSTDEGARRVGELAFGLNYSIDRFTRMILFDEKIGGTMHIALGASYPDTGGKNKSAIHWDMITDMSKGRVYADGELVFENGQFLV